MAYRMICTRCGTVILDATEHFSDNDLVRAKEHCDREHGIDVTTLPIPDLVALLRIDDYCPPSDEGTSPPQRMTARR